MSVKNTKVQFFIQQAKSTYCALHIDKKRRNFAIRLFLTKKRKLLR